MEVERGRRWEKDERPVGAASSLASLGLRSSLLTCRGRREAYERESRSETRRMKGDEGDLISAGDGWTVQPGKRRVKRERTRGTGGGRYIKSAFERRDGVKEERRGEDWWRVALQRGGGGSTQRNRQLFLTSPTPNQNSSFLSRGWTRSVEGYLLEK